jgi:hypothetical protein
MSTPDLSTQQAAAQNMREITYSQAVKEALAEEMRRDPHVFIIGEDVADRRVAPMLVLNTIGTFSFPPDI